MRGAPLQGYFRKRFNSNGFVGKIELKQELLKFTLVVGIFNFFSTTALCLVSLDRLCILKSDVNFSRIYVFYPEKFQCLELVCGDDLKNLEINTELRYNLMARSLKQKKFNGTRANRVPLIDEYILKTPFLFKLKCPHELKSVVRYLKKKFTELKISPLPNVPLLISLDYRAQALDKLCKAHEPELDLDFENQSLTNEEVAFLNKYFSVYSEQHARLFFDLYHRMLFQIEKIKKCYENNDEFILVTIFDFIKHSLKDLGLIEVLYRLFLIKLILLLGQNGKDFYVWILRGAHRGHPAEKRPRRRLASLSDSAGSPHGGRSDSSTTTDCPELPS